MSQKTPRARESIRVPSPQWPPQKDSYQLGGRAGSIARCAQTSESLVPNSLRAKELPSLSQASRTLCAPAATQVAHLRIGRHSPGRIPDGSLRGDFNAIER
jgi:hypothetical protein